jgi:hypothetical protein
MLISKRLSSVLSLSLLLLSGTQSAEAGWCSWPPRFPPYQVPTCSVANGHSELTAWGIRNPWLVELLEIFRIPASLWAQCVTDSCNSGFSLYANACYATTRACTVANGTGTQTFSHGAYGACAASSCHSGFVLTHGSCQPKSRACTIANGTGVQNWANGAYGACQLVSCNSGYTGYQGACYAKELSCTVPHGSGIKVFEGAKGYSTCVANTCASGYALIGGACKSTAPPQVTVRAFPSPRQLQLPAEIDIPGSLFSDQIKITLAGANGETINCYYDNPFNSPAYTLSGCNLGPVDCAWGECQKGTDFKPLDLVIADSLTVTSPPCDGANCASAVVDQIGGQNAPACGANVAANAHLTGDLSCPGAGPALSLQTNGVTLDGRGHSVKGAGVYGLRVLAKNVTVQNVASNGNAGGTGLFAWNADALTLAGNSFAANQIGADLQFDAAPAVAPRVYGNELGNNGVIGVRVSGPVQNPVIANNDFADSGQYAMFLNVNSASFNGLAGNVLDGSLYGIGFQNGQLSIQNADFSGAGVLRSNVVATDAALVSISSSNLSLGGEGRGDDEQVAVSLYRVRSASLNAVLVKNADIGIREATDHGVAAVFQLKNSSLKHNGTAGLLITSFDGTVFGTFTVTDNDFTGNRNGNGIVLGGTTQVGAGSVFSNNQQ